MDFAGINGATVHYRHRPSAGRPTIVFVNSLGTDMRIWNQIERMLGGSFAFVSFDKRGHGLSELGTRRTRLRHTRRTLLGCLTISA